MHITPVFTNTINNNKQNPQNTAFGYGVSINLKNAKKHGRGHGDGIRRYLDRIQVILTGLREDFLAIIEKAKTDANVSEDDMKTIGIKIHAKQDLIPEVVIEVKGIEDKNPIIVSDLTMIGGMDDSEKLQQIKTAVEQKARESATLAKNSGSSFAISA